MLAKGCYSAKIKSVNKHFYKGISRKLPAIRYYTTVLCHGIMPPFNGNYECTQLYYNILWLLESKQ